MTPDKIELLLMLSEDVKAQGDDLSAEMIAKGAAHARRVEELYGMLQRAMSMLEVERQKFQKYLPVRQQEPVTRLPQALGKMPG